MTGRTRGRGARPASGRLWAYGAAGLGGLVSIAANIAHTYVPPAGVPVAELDSWGPPAGAVALSVFWPVALFAAVEVIARNPWPAGWRWVVLRWAGLVPVAAVAALVSYRHLSGLMRFYREDALTAAVGPLAVDGLMVMATAALIATSAHRTGSGAVDAGPAGVSLPAAMSLPGWDRPVTLMVDETAELAEQVLGRRDADRRDGGAPTVDANPDATGPAPASKRRSPVPSGPAGGRTAAANGRAGGRSAGRWAGTGERVARLRERYPDWTVAQVAARAGVSVRTARRHLNAPTTSSSTTTTAASSAPATDGPASESTEGTEAA